jgi:hypothetical protein
MSTKKLTYSEQLAHPNWQKKRLEILSRDGFMCHECAAKDITLHVHHKAYIKGKMAWEYDDEFYQSLCKDCHKRVEEYRATLADTIRDFEEIDMEQLRGFAKALRYGVLRAENPNDETRLEISSYWEAVGWARYWKSSEGTHESADKILARGCVGGAGFNPTHD